MTERSRLVRELERLVPLLEDRTRHLGSTPFVSSQQLVGEVAAHLWQLRRGRLVRPWSLALLLAEGGPVAEMARLNGWISEFEDLGRNARVALTALNRIRYQGTDTAVHLGDHVGLRVLLRKRTGRVTYVPGVSVPSAQIDFGGLFRIGIQVPSGPFVQIHVDPQGLEVQKGVTFIRRDDAAIPACPTDEELREDV